MFCNLLLVSVLPPAAIQLNSQGEIHNMPTLTMSNTSSSGTILQYASQDGQYFVPGNIFFNAIVCQKITKYICNLNV